MPPVRSLVSVYYILLATSISLNSKIMSLYSYYMKKKLVYITIIALFSRQPSSYFKYTKANTYFFYNVRSILVNKYTFLIFSYLVALPYPLGANTWWYIVLLTLC